MKFILKLFLAIVVIAACVFAIANRETITLDLWPLPFSIAIWSGVAVLIAFAVGLFFGALYPSISKIRVSGRARASERRARVLEQSREHDMERDMETPQRTTNPALPRR